MRNIIIIKNNIVVDVIQVNDDWESSTYTIQAFDTACDDQSCTFKIGDDYTPEKLLEYNKTLWIQLGWIKDPNAPTTYMMHQYF